jgi:Ca-activated chloride channel family protein
MRFLWPDLLWLLLGAPALVAAYLYALKRKKPAVQYASLRLVRDALGRTSWRRHVPPLLFLFAVLLAILAMARPSAVFVLPSQQQTIVLAIDVSRSMRATDVEPNRITAAQAAAKSFVEELPKNIRVGVVSFAGTAAVVQTPTESRDDLLTAIDRFQLQRGTATGSGLLVSLALLLPDAGIDLESIVFDSAFSRWGGGAAPIDRARKAEKAGKKDLAPVAPGSYTSGVIIMMSDGRRTTGPDPVQAAKMAADRGVRVYTVGFGTREGATVDSDGWSFYARLDEDALKAVAHTTNAEYFYAGTAADLRAVYQKLNSKLAMERKDTEVSALFSIVAALFVFVAALLSLLWFHRSA